MSSRWATKAGRINTTSNITLPEPLVPRGLRLPVAERLDNTGQDLRPLDGQASAN